MKTTYKECDGPVAAIGLIYMKIRTTIQGPEMRQMISGFSSPSSSDGPTERGKGHEPDRERTYDWSKQKEWNPKVSSEFRQRRERSPFLLGPVKSEIPVAEQRNGSRQLRWTRDESLTYKMRHHKKEKWCLAIR